MAKGAWLVFTGTAANRFSKNGNAAGRKNRRAPLLFHPAFKDNPLT
jgi:hypothetical protein